MQQNSANSLHETLSAVWYAIKDGYGDDNHKRNQVRILENAEKLIATAEKTQPNEITSLERDIRHSAPKFRFIAPGHSILVS